MKEARTPGLDEGKWESARRCLVAAERSANREERLALGRAGLRYLCGSLGICRGGATIREAAPPRIAR
jgi:hypothetical protein